MRRDGRFENRQSMGDCLVCIHNVQQRGEVVPFEDTLQTIGYLLIEKARCAAETMGESLN